MKIGPGTVVLNQKVDEPYSGTVVPTPKDESENSDCVWVQWALKSVGKNGLCEEFLQDVTLTGKVVWID